MLELRDIKYKYEKKKLLFRGIDMEFKPATLYAITGPSGCGKTTLLSLIGGLDDPFDGEILFEGVKLSEERRAAHRKNNVSFIFQNFNLIDYLTAQENVSLVTKLPALPMLEKLGLKEAETKRRAAHLSGGQQQRVAIARALASDAPIILADEPTGNLDEENSREVAQLLYENTLEAGKCVSVVTHSASLANMADHRYKLQAGRLTAYL